MRPCTCLLLVLLVGCDSSGPSNGGPGSEEPTGWIYGTPWGSNTTLRVNAQTGQTEPVLWMNPPVDEFTLPVEGSISPIDGDLALQGETGWGWDRTFVLDAATGTYREFDPPEVAIEKDFRWSPDGTHVVFLRRAVQGDTRDRLVRLNVVTGVIDTLLSPDEAVGLLSLPFWIGSDTVGVSVDERPQIGEFPHHYLRIATASLVFTEFDEIPWSQYHIPLVSADRKWLAHWIVHDSTPPDGQSTEFATLRIRNRTTDAERTLWSFPVLTTSEGSTSIAFSPDGRFLASCQTNTEVTIFAVATALVTGRRSHPYCTKLNWGWGPEGPAAP